ncbi:hypothetical protein QKC54_gp0134 [Megavirus baoshan]|uniref:Uncharacterized protein n=1 Tax=Megavirus baoshan TaxID=2496520 RepID=A0A8K1W9G4_9VIRU|nr:hypothetical protein QKC54_gp0134 [Megavirus baoshan]UFX99896.1 hypothetical protein Mb0938 [Megavirus baoshan]
MQNINRKTNSNIVVIIIIGPIIGIEYITGEQSNISK